MAQKHCTPDRCVQRFCLIENLFQSIVASDDPLLNRPFGNRRVELLHQPQRLFKRDDETMR